MTDVPEHLRPKCEVVKLPMICVCGRKDEPNPKLEAATALYERAKALLSTDSSPCTDDIFMSRAVGRLSWSYNAEFECAVDQWFGAYATVNEYIDCEHGKLADRLIDEKKAAGTEAQQAIKEGYAESACPDEPECFVYGWAPTLKVRVECDHLEHGLAQLVIWFEENRKNEEDE